MTRKLSIFVLLQIGLSVSLGQYVPPTLIDPPEGSVFQMISSTPTYITSNLYLFCQAAGDQSSLVYTWMLNSITLNMNQANVKWNPTLGGLNISSPVTEGTYQCTVLNMYTRAMAISNITQVVINRLDPSPTSTDYPGNGPVGSALTLPCDTSQAKIVPGVVYDWQRVASRTAPTASEVFLDNRVQVDPNGGLNFAYLLASDATTTNYYRCHLVSSTDNSKETSLSYSKLTVTPLINPPTSLQLQFRSPIVYGLVGQTAILKCFFSGAQDTVITWTFNGQPRNGGRFVPDQSMLTINLLVTDDAGTYTCSGKSASFSSPATSTVQLFINAVPTFTPSMPGLTNTNATIGGSVKMSCNPYAIPAPTVIWYQNGVPLIPHALPKKISIDTATNTLTVSQLVKTSNDDGGGPSVIQCNASNTNGSVLGQGYINVLDPTVFVIPPTDQILTYPDRVNFTCEAGYDITTPVTYTWTFEGAAISDGKVNTSLPCQLYITIDGLSDKGHQYLGTWRITISNGVSSTFTDVQLKLPGALQAGIWSLWWVPLLIILLFILILLLILLCCCCCYRNRGDAYPDPVAPRSGPADFLSGRMMASWPSGRGFKSCSGLSGFSVQKGKLNW